MVMRRLIRQTLLKVQLPVMRQNYLRILRDNTDLGRPVEWSAPLQRNVMGRTIELYESEFGARPIATEELLNEMEDTVFERLFERAEAEGAEEQPLGRL